MRELFKKSEAFKSVFGYEFIQYGKTQNMSKTLSDLHNAIQAQGSQLRIGKDLLGSEKLTNLWRQFLHISEISLKQASLSNLGSNDTFSVSGRTSLLSFGEQAVKISFFEGKTPADKDMQLECVIEVTTTINNWIMGSDFNDWPKYLDYDPGKITQGLQDSFLHNLPFKQVQFVFSSFDFSQKKNTHNFKGNIKVENTEITKGNTFSAQIPTDGDYWQVVKLIYTSLPNNVRVVAQIKGDGEPQLFEAAFLITGIKYQPVSAFSLALKKLLIRSGMRSNSLITPYFEFECLLDNKLDVNIGIDIGNKQVRIEGKAEQEHIFSFADLAKLAGADEQTLKKALPEKTGSSYFGKLGLRSVELDLTVSPARVDEIIIVVSAEKPWKFFDDKISLLPLLGFQVSNPTNASRSIEMEIIGLWKIGGTGFRTLANISEKWVIAEMMPGEKLDIAKVFASWLPGIPHPHIELNDMYFEGNFQTKTYTVKFSADSSLPFSVGTTQVFVNNILFWAEIGSTKNWKFSGDVTLGIFRLEVRASHASANNWTIYGGVSMSEEVSFTEVFGHLLDHLHPARDKTLPSAVPANYGSFKINSLWIEYASANKTLKVFLDLEVKIEITEGFAFEEIVFDLEFDTSGFANGFVQAKLLLEKVEITLQTTKKAGKGVVFEGTSTPNQEIAIGKLVEELAQKLKFQNNLPKALEKLRVENLKVLYKTQTKDLTFSLETKFPLDDKEIDAVIDTDIIHNSGKYSIKFSGIVKLSGLEFVLAFSKESVSQTFAAAYNNPAGGKTDLHKLVENVSSSLAGVVPTGLSITLKDALMARVSIPSRGGKTETKLLFVLHVGSGIDLSNLPLVGKLFPHDQTIQLSYQILAASKYFSDQEASSLNSLIGDGVSYLPEGAIGDKNHKNKSSLDLATSIRFGNTVKKLNLPVGVGSSGKLTDTGDTSKPIADDTSNMSGTGAAGDKTKWFQLQKSFGPVHFDRLGVKYQSKKIWFLLDASLSAGGLTVGLEGLSVSSPLTKFDPEFNLQGLSIDYQNQAVEIGGAFLRKHIVPPTGDPYDEYDGMLVVKAEELTLSAIGSYAYVNGHPSLFVYAVLDYPIGGPAFFFITGLAGGFGYNRNLQAPSIDKVAQFPLVEEAVNNTGDTGNLAAELDKISKYISPAVGEYFLAVGIKFNSFKLVDSFVLLTASFGNRFELDLLGLSTALLPPAEDGKEVVTPLAEVQMALKVSFIPSEGFLGVRAQLTSASYLLSKNCHLTGGFAFYCWFSGTHAGDFVTTLGGYHPSFQVPSHYPQVPRLGFNWRVDSHITIKGDAYFALCSHAFMAGGHLDATYHRGALKAWFKVGADFLIAWKPYHYDARVYIDIGASYTFHFFGTHHITVDLGADLHIWGPEFGGTATIHIWIVKIHVSFGDSSSQKPKAISWDSFKKSFLPEADKVCTIVVKDGLVRKVGDDDSDLGIINPKHFCLVTDAIIPSKEAYKVVHDPSKQDDKTKKVSIPIEKANTNFGIGSMEVSDSDLKTKQTIEITKTGGSVEENDFEYIPILKKVPAGMWGNSLSPDLNGTKFIDNALSGFEIKPGTPQTAGQTRKVERKKLQLEAHSGDNRHYSWEKNQIKFNASNDQDETRRQNISKNLVTNAARNSLLQNMGFDPNEDVDLNKEVAADFLVAPQVKA